MNKDETAVKKRITIILASNKYQKVSNALSIALAALACGMEAHILLFFDSITRFTIGHLNDIGDETPHHLHAAIKAGINRGAIQPLDKQLADAKELGLKVYACPNAMAAFEVSTKDLIEVDEVMGLISFIALVDGASSNWYI
jgi:peroxiredoxin family protein